MSSPPKESPEPGRQAWKGRLKQLAIRLLVTFGVLLLITATAIKLFPEATLGWVIKKWEIEHPLQSADAIIVLGGGNHFRPQHAATLWEQGLAPTVLTFKPEKVPENNEKPSRNPNITDKNSLIRLGLPETALEEIKGPVNSSWDEAAVIYSWIEEKQFSTVIIVTDRFHSRRVNWLMERTLGEETSCEYIISHSPWHFYQTDSWWQNEQGKRAFRRELFRMAYYIIFYSFRS